MNFSNEKLQVSLRTRLWLAFGIRVRSGTLWLQPQPVAPGAIMLQEVQAERKSKV